MKLRLPALLLAAVLALSIPAGAAQGTFVRSKTYAGQFSDLSRDSVFYDNVSALYEYGLSVGKADGRFACMKPATQNPAPLPSAPPDKAPPGRIFSISNPCRRWGRSWTAF